LHPIVIGVRHGNVFVLGFKQVSGLPKRYFNPKVDKHMDTNIHKNDIEKQTL
jgi:hypothetical protein